MALDSASSLAANSTLDRARSTLRRIAVQGVSGVVAGIVVGGVGGRVVMRVSALAAGDDVVGRITENGNRIGVISLDGTIALIVFGGALTGAVAAILVVMLRTWLRWAGRWQGLVTGVALLGIAGAILIDAANRDFHILDPGWFNVALFAVLIVGYGWAAVALADWWLQRHAEPARAVFHIAPIAIGAPLTIPLFGSFLSTEFCTCDDPMVGVGIALIAVGAVTAAAMIAEIAGRHEASRRLQPAGVAFVAIAVLLGTARLIAEIATIT